MICNKCGNENAENAKFCRFCGNALSDSAPQKPENEPAPAEHTDGGSEEKATLQGMAAGSEFGSLEAAPKLTVKKNLETENAAYPDLSENNREIYPDSFAALPSEALSTNEAQVPVQEPPYDAYNQHSDAYQQQDNFNQQSDAAYQQQDAYNQQPDAAYQQQDNYQSQPVNGQTAILYPEEVQNNMQGENIDRTSYMEPDNVSAVNVPNNAQWQNNGGIQAENSFNVQNNYPAYANNTPVYAGIGEAVKKSSKSILSLLSCFLFTGAFVLYILGSIDSLMLSINNIESMWLNVAEFSVITFTCFITLLGMWISFFGALGRSRPRCFGISLIRFSNTFAVIAFTVYLLATVFTAIFTVVSFGISYFEGGALSTVILILVLIFNIVFCSRIISNCSKARSAVKTGTVDGKASVLLPILCFAVGIISIGCAAFSIVSSSYSNCYLLLNILFSQIAVILFGLSCLFSGMNSLLFRINFEKAKY